MPISTGETGGNSPNRSRDPKIRPANLTERVTRVRERRSFGRRKLGRLVDGDPLRRLIDLQVENDPEWRFPR